jgi:hypothetical protein
VCVVVELQNTHQFIATRTDGIKPFGHTAALLIPGSPGLQQYCNGNQVATSSKARRNPSQGYKVELDPEPPSTTIWPQRPKSQVISRRLPNRSYAPCTRRVRDGYIPTVARQARRGLKPNWLKRRRYPRRPFAPWPRGGLHHGRPATQVRNKSHCPIHHNHHLCVDVPLLRWPQL